MVRSLLIIACVSLAVAGGAVAKPPVSAAAQEYEEARRHYFALKASAERKKFRHHWLRAISAFMRVREEFPESDEAERALYTAGDLWRGLYKVSRQRSDLDQAVATFERLVGEYPKSRFADDAAAAAAQLKGRAEDGRPKAESREPRTENRGPTAEDRGPDAGAPPGARLFGRLSESSAIPHVTRLSQWSTPRYARVVAELSGPAQARSAWGKRTSEATPLFVDISPATLAEGLTAPSSADDVLREVRTEQIKPDTVRLHLTLTRPTRPRIMILESPYRVVIDAFLEEAQPQLVTAAPKVVLDAGHGGKDTGAIGPSGTREKDVALAIAKATAELLSAAGVEVSLTREDDTFVPLDQRTAHANRAEADVLVSIHANAAKQRSARGLETYYLDTTDDRFALRLAARENATNEEQVSDAQLVLADMATKATTRDSYGLAKGVQSRLMSAGRKRTPKLPNHGVKASLFYVLLGARMPAILVETGFISNREEEKLLASASYQRELATAIADGVLAHLRAKKALPSRLEHADLRSP